MYVCVWLFYRIIGEYIYLFIYLPICKNGITSKISLASQPMATVCESV